MASSGTDLLLAALGGLAVGVVGTMALGRGTAQAAPRPAAGVVPAGLVPWGIGPGGTVDPAGAVKTNPYGYLVGKGRPVYDAMPRAPLQVRPLIPSFDSNAFLNASGISCGTWRGMTPSQKSAAIQAFFDAQAAATERQQDPYSSLLPNRAFVLIDAATMGSMIAAVDARCSSGT